MLKKYVNDHKLSTCELSTRGPLTREDILCILCVYIKCILWGSVGYGIHFKGSVGYGIHFGGSVGYENALQKRLGLGSFPDNFKIGTV